MEESVRVLRQWIVQSEEKQASTGSLAQLETAYVCHHSDVTGAILLRREMERVCVWQRQGRKKIFPSFLA